MQRGSGLGALFVSLFRGLVPVLRSTAKVALKSAAKGGRKMLTSKVTKRVAKKVLTAAKKNVAKAGMNAALNALEGKNVKEGAKSDLQSARKDLARAFKAGVDGDPDERPRRVSAVKGGNKWKNKKKRKKLAHFNNSLI